jgi:hypothetical protein
MLLLWDNKNVENNLVLLSHYVSSSTKPIQILPSYKNTQGYKEGILKNYDDERASAGTPTAFAPLTNYIWRVKQNVRETTMVATSLLVMLNNGLNPTNQITFHNSQIRFGRVDFRLLHQLLSDNGVMFVLGPQGEAGLDKWDLPLTASSSLPYDSQY